MKNMKILLILSIVIIAVIGLFFWFLKNEQGDWTINDGVVSRGNESYNIGDVYEYDETNDGKISNLTDVEWKVFGVEDGNLLIMSDRSVGNVTLGNMTSLEDSKNDYISGKDKLNSIASLYGKGKSALGARSINIDDIDKFMGYDKTKYSVGQVNDYGNDISYFWGDIDKNIIYKDNQGNEGYVSNKHDSFTYFDEVSKSFKVVDRVEASEDNPVLIATIRNDFYNYGNSIVYGGDTNIPKNYSVDSKEYKMLFSDGTGNINNYWLASNFTYAYHIFVNYGYWVVKGSDVNYTSVVYSVGKSRDYTAGVRAIVIID